MSASTPRYDSEPASPDVLGQPLHFGFSGKTAPNRFLKAAMSERLASWNLADLTDRGVPSNELIEVYRRWGEGGWGVILSGNIMVAPDQLEAPGNMIIPANAPFSGPRFEAFAAMGRAAKVAGGLMVAQVSHPGRQTTEALQPNPISASDVKLDINLFGMTFAKPHPASEAEIKHVIDSFAHTAEYLHKAGWDGIELHGAHGYLLAQFLSQTTNQRKDQYGGDLEHRARIITEVAAAVRQRVPKDFIVGIKMNSVEFQDKGFTPAEAKKLVALLEDNQFDFVELSGGTYESIAFMHKRESTKKREAFFMDFADEIVPALSRTKAYVTGGFQTVGNMAAALKTVDGVGIGRAATQEPRLPNDILSGKVQGVVKQQFSPDDFMMTNVVAGSQIKQIGKGHEPLDGSNDEHVKGFQQDMGIWAKDMAEAGLSKTGFVDVSTVAPVPYGPAALA